MIACCVQKFGKRGFCSLGGEREGRCGRVLFGGKSSCA
jgi:hypothetical protein